MMDWKEFCEVTRKKLNRELKEQEIAFLKWIYKRYQAKEEVKETKESS